MTYDKEGPFYKAWREWINGARGQELCEIPVINVMDILWWAFCSGWNAAERAAEHKEKP